MSRHDDIVTLRQITVDYKILWDIVTADFPPLAHQIRDVIQSNG